jgi:hypothetical protein
VRLEGLGQLKKSNDIIRNRIRDLLACSIAPQPTKLPRTPVSLPVLNFKNFRQTKAVSCRRLPLKSFIYHVMQCGQKLNLAEAY